MTNKIAPEGQVWVCRACGKRSRDLYGNDPISYGWDESCMLNAALYDEATLTIEGGRVVGIKSGAARHE